MRTLSFQSWNILALLAALWLVAATGHAPDRAAAQQPAEHVTVMVVDMSGSTGPRDALNLRCAALRVFVDLAGPGEQLGVVFFPGVGGAPYEIIADPLPVNDHRTALKSAATCYSDGPTPLDLALQQAYAMLEQHTRGGQHTGSVILASDGDPEPNAAAQWAAIERLQGSFAAQRWPIDVIGLNYESERFKAIASATGGKAYKATAPLDLITFFADIHARHFGRHVRTLSRQVRLGDTPPAPIAMTIDPYSRRIDVLVARTSPAIEVFLLRPDGSAVKPTDRDLTLLSEDEYYLAYGITSPQQGEWRLAMSGSGEASASLLVDSRLQLRLEEPSVAQPLNLPVRITASLLDENSRVLDQSTKITALIDAYDGQPQLTLQLNDRGTDGDPIAADGFYTHLLNFPLDAPEGSYGVTLAAKIGDVEIPPLAEQVITLKRVPPVRLEKTEFRALRDQPLALKLGLADPAGRLLPRGELNIQVFSERDGQSEPLEATLLSDGVAVTIDDHQAGLNHLRYVLVGSYAGVALTGIEGVLEYAVAYRPQLELALDPPAGPPYPLGEPITITAALYRSQRQPAAVAEGGLTASIVGGPAGALPALSLHDDGRWPDASAGDGIFTAVHTPTSALSQTIQVEFADSGGPVVAQATLTAAEFPRVAVPVNQYAVRQPPPFLGRLLLSPLSIIPVPDWRTTIAITGVVQSAPGETVSGGAIGVDVRGPDQRLLLTRALTDGATIDLVVQPPESGVYTLETRWKGRYAGRDYERRERHAIMVSLSKPPLVEVLGYGLAELVWLAVLAVLAAFLAAIAIRGLTYVFLWIRWALSPRPQGYLANRAARNSVEQLRGRPRSLYAPNMIVVDPPAGAGRDKQYHLGITLIVQARWPFVSTTTWLWQGSLDELAPKPASAAAGAAPARGRIRAMAGWLARRWLELAYSPALRTVRFQRQAVREAARDLFDGARIGDYTFYKQHPHDRRQ